MIGRDEEKSFVFFFKFKLEIFSIIKMRVSVFKPQSKGYLIRFIIAIIILSKRFSFINYLFVSFFLTDAKRLRT